MSQVKNYARFHDAKGGPLLTEILTRFGTLKTKWEIYQPSNDFPPVYSKDNTLLTLYKVKLSLLLEGDAACETHGSLVFIKAKSIAFLKFYKSAQFLQSLSFHTFNRFQKLSALKY